MNDNFETNESLDFDFKPINKGLGFHQKNNPVAKPLSDTELTEKKADLRRQHQKDLLQRSVTLENTDFRNKIELPKKIETEEIEASLLTRSAAFLVDLLFVVSNVLLTIYLMPWSTFGKYFCNLKVVCENGSRLSFNESLMRSLLSIAGLPLLIFNWHGKLTRTKVMEA